MTAAVGSGAGPASGDTRRDFLYLTAGAFGTIGSALALWPFIDSMNPAADVLALGTIEVTLTPIEPGQRVTAKWRGRPVFIDRRTPGRIAAARSEDIARLPDPEADAARVKNPEWLVVVGICTHQGCVPLGQRPTDPRGEYGGWFCPCHGSHYDTSGRIRRGPAPRNLAVPPYAFIDPVTLRIG